MPHRDFATWPIAMQENTVTEIIETEHKGVPCEMVRGNSVCRRGLTALTLSFADSKCKDGKRAAGDRERP